MRSFMFILHENFLNYDEIRKYRCNYWVLRLWFVHVAATAMYEQACRLSTEMHGLKSLQKQVWNFRDRLQILLVILDEFKRINELPFLLKSSRASRTIIIVSSCSSFCKMDSKRLLPTWNQCKNVFRIMY